MAGELLVHGTCVAIGSCGVLLRGAPGSGKSDLALRLIERPPKSAGAVTLVADDQVVISRDGDALIASAPEALRGKLEVRGVGILEIDHQASVPLRLVVELTDRADIERLPDHSSASAEIRGTRMPMLKLYPLEASAPAKLALAAARIDTLFSH